MKKLIYSTLVLFFLLVINAYSQPTGGPSRIYTSTECNATAYYPNGVLCQDTDDDKLYKGTGSGVTEITSGTAFSVTDITGATDDTTPATTATAVLAQGGSLIESTLAEIGTAINPTAATLHVDDILTALGIASEATHFGAFTGSTIADSQTAKAALQALETSLELKVLAASGTHTGLTTLNALAFSAAQAVTEVSDAVSAVTASKIVVTSETSTTDTLKEITCTGTCPSLLLVFPAAGHTITITDTASSTITIPMGSTITIVSTGLPFATFIYDYLASKYVAQNMPDTINFSAIDMTSGTFTLPSSNADPAAVAGRIMHDSSSTESQTTARGVLKWNDGTSVRTLADIGTDSAMITKTEFLPIRYAEDGTAGPAAAAAVTGKIIIARSFTDTKDVVFFWVVPNDFVGAGVKYRVHYALASDASADDTVTFTTTGCIIANSGDVACSAGTGLAISDELGTSDDQYQYMVSDYSAESNADWGVAAGGLIKLGFSYSDGDYDAAALVIGIEIKYKAKLDGFASY